MSAIGTRYQVHLNRDKDGDDVEIEGPDLTLRSFAGLFCPLEKRDGRPSLIDLYRIFGESKGAAKDGSISDPDTSRYRGARFRDSFDESLGIMSSKKLVGYLQVLAMEKKARLDLDLFLHPEYQTDEGIYNAVKLALIFVKLFFDQQSIHSKNLYSVKVTKEPAFLEKTKQAFAAIKLTVQNERVVEGEEEEEEVGEEAEVEKEEVAEEKEKQVVQFSESDPSLKKIKNREFVLFSSGTTIDAVLAAFVDLSNIKFT